jgi:serine/threonine-protein kinase
LVDAPVRVVGRYALYGEIAAGGMATVHLGRLLGPVGFSRTVAIKRLHPQFAKDPDFVSMFLDEARLAARVQHPNVVPTLDVISLEDELFIVMEYVEGESLARVLRATRTAERLLPPTLVGAVMTGALYGLHAAHEAKSERGTPLEIIHRDVSPQNILVGIDGVSRVLDFGVAKAAVRAQTTRDGQMKGKLAYMAPEQILGETQIDRRVDVYAAGVVAWEALVARRLFEGQNEGAIMRAVLSGEVRPPSSLVPDVPRAADAVLLKAMSLDREKRFATAFEFAVALEESLGIDSNRRVAAYVSSSAGEAIARRSQRVRQLESLTEADLAGLTAGPASGTRANTTIDHDDKTELTRQGDRRVLYALGAAALLGVAVALGIVALVRGRRDQPDTARPTPTASAVVASRADATSTAATSTTATVAPSPSASASAGPTASARAEGPGPTIVPPRTGAPFVRPTATATVVAPTGPKPGCNPPFVLVDGIRKLKPECID